MEGGLRMEETATIAACVAILNGSAETLRH
jgi:hypothetical protein